MKELSLFSYFLFFIVPAIAALPPPSFVFFPADAPDAPNRSPRATIVFLSDYLKLKEEGDIHREERGRMIIGLSIGGRGVI